jgi:hypothetical protein
VKALRVIIGLYDVFRGLYSRLEENNFCFHLSVSWRAYEAVRDAAFASYFKINKYDYESALQVAEAEERRRMEGGEFMFLGATGQEALNWLLNK